MPRNGTHEALLLEIGAALSPLEAALSSPDEMEALLAALGWQPPPGAWDLVEAATAAVNLTTKLVEAAGAPPEVKDDPLAMASRFGDVLVALDETVRAVSRAATQLEESGLVPADYLAETRIREELPRRLFDYLLIRHAFTRTPVAAAALALAGVFELDTFDEDPTRYQTAHIRHTLHADRLPLLISDPARLMREVYGWGTDAFDLDKLFLRSAWLVHALGGQPTRRALPRKAEEHVLGRPIPPDAAPMPQVFLSLLTGLVPQAELDIGVSLFGLRPSSAGAIDAGVGVMPYAIGASALEIPLNDLVSIVIEGAADIAGGFGVLLRPGKQPEIFRDVLSTGTADTPATAQLGIGLRLSREPASIRLLSLGGATLRVKTIRIVAGARLASDGRIEPYLELSLRGGAFGIETAEADSLVKTVVPADSAVLEFDLDLGWSPERGFYLLGSATLEISIGVHVPIGPFTIDTFHVVPGASQSGLSLELSLSGSGRLGPIAVSVHRLGATGRFSFAPGNLGPLAFSPELSGPRGLGLVIDAGVVSGGGFLEHDADRGRYTGVAVLGVNAFTLTAIGIVDTKMPDVPSGFSLVLIAAAEFAPIQLGLGFTLNGVGGLAAVNRTFAADALRSGIRTGGVDAILFPEDPIGDAPTILRQLDQVFPVAPGRTVLGPMLLLGWGTPTIAEAELGVLIELPGLERIAILGAISVALPHHGTPIVELHLDALGTIDFSRKRLAIDASLYDSYVALYDVQGDMALRLSWGDQPELVLAIGGFHPQFPAPPGFPSLRRLTISLGPAERSPFVLQAYLAVTSNTVQLGARIELELEAAGFVLQGWLGFDALMTLSPFAFKAAISGGVKLMRDGTLLAAIWVDATISGPTPWRVAGEASASALFLDVTIPFDVSFGEPRAVDSPAVDPRPLLRAAIEDPRNWTASPALGALPVASFVARDPDAAPRIDPASGVTLRQKVVPLGRRITRFGSVAPVGPDRYEISSVTLDARATTDVAPVTDHFAAAQFEAMSDAEKLSRPSFERMTSGIAVGGSMAAHGRGIAVTPGYDTIVIDGGARREGSPYEPSREAQLETDRRASPSMDRFRGARAGRFSGHRDQQRLFELEEDAA